MNSSLIRRPSAYVVWERMLKLCGLGITWQFVYPASVIPVRAFNDAVDSMYPSALTFTGICECVCPLRSYSSWVDKSRCIMFSVIVNFQRDRDVKLIVRYLAISGSKSPVLM